MIPGRRWDIFCNVVDNFGDIGVSWRLARQLAAEHGLTVRLWVDDLASLARLCPQVDAHMPSQVRRGVCVRRWEHPFAAWVAPEEVADVVVEAFACELPAAYVDAMARRQPRPRWIDLEYLSAEAWVEGCHGLPSPHPRLPLVGHFFFPGFTARCGGLLREHGLFEARNAFRADRALRNGFFSSLGLGEPSPEVLAVSLFGYENRAVGELLDAWCEGQAPVLCLVPESRLLADVAACLGVGLEAGARLQRGNLELRVIPFVDQDSYDRLLWCCDLNFVRGEDSFVRAQWAAVPLVWHIYPQQDDAHWRKLEAFLERYCAGLHTEAAVALTAFWRAWNSGQGVGRAWPDFHAQRCELAAHAVSWAREQALRPDLAAALVAFGSSPV